MKFPKIMGNELSGMTFLEIFETKPKIVEYVSSCWTSATGVFEEFRSFIIDKLSSSSARAEHEARCREFVKTHEELPQYMLKYNGNQ